MNKQNTIIEPEPEALEPEEWAWQCVADYADWLSEDEARALIYFVEADMWTKIGIARDVRDRIRQLQTGCPYKMELKGVIPSSKPLLTEAIMHDLFTGCEKRGEWYCMGYDDIEKAAKSVRAWAIETAKNLREILH